MDGRTPETSVEQFRQQLAREADESRAQERVWLEKISDPLLSDQEKYDLLNEADKGIRPAEVKQFEDLESFVLGSENFTLFFSGGEDAENVANPIGYMYSRKKVMQRFRLLHPDLCTTLTTAVNGLNRAEIDEVAWAGLYEAYQLMSGLVDVEDLGVKDKEDRFLIL